MILYLVGLTADLVAGREGESRSSGQHALCGLVVFPGCIRKVPLVSGPDGQTLEYSIEELFS